MNVTARPARPCEFASTLRDVRNGRARRVEPITASAVLHQAERDKAMGMLTRDLPAGDAYRFGQARREAHKGVGDDQLVFNGAQGPVRAWRAAASGGYWRADRP